MSVPLVHWTAQSAEIMLDTAGVAPGCNVPRCLHGATACWPWPLRSEDPGSCAPLDFAEAMVAAAHRQRTDGGVSSKATRQDLPYAENTFDAVVCGYGIIHLPEPDRALVGNAPRASPWEGRVAISIWERPSPNNGFRSSDGRNKKAHGRLDVPLPHGP